MKDIRVASVQFEHAAGDKEGNFAKVVKFVEQAAEQKVDMAAFPECCITGYWTLRDLSREELDALNKILESNQMEIKGFRFYAKK